MDTFDTMLQAIQRTQHLRAEAQRLWWLAQTARQQFDDLQRYTQLMQRHQLVLAQIHQALADSPKDQPAT